MTLRWATVSTEVRRTRLQPRSCWNSSRIRPFTQWYGLSFSLKDFATWDIFCIGATSYWQFSSYELQHTGRNLASQTLIGERRCSWISIKSPMLGLILSRIADPSLFMLKIFFAVLPNPIFLAITSRALVNIKFVTCGFEPAQTYIFFRKPDFRFLKPVSVLRICFV